MGVTYPMDERADLAFSYPGHEVLSVINFTVHSDDNFSRRSGVLLLILDRNILLSRKDITL